MEEIFRDGTQSEYSMRSVVTASIGLTVVIAYLLSMNVLFLLIALQAPVWLVTIVFFIVVFATVQLLSSETVFRLTENGIEREIIPRYAFLKKLHRKEFFQWDSIHSYRIDRTINRQGHEYPFLKVTDDTKRTWTIAGKSLDDGAFITFSETFKVCITSCKSSTATHVKLTRSPTLRIAGFILLVLTEIALIVLILVLNTQDTPRLILRVLATMCIPTVYVAIRMIRR